MEHILLGILLAVSVFCCVLVWSVLSHDDGTGLSACFLIMLMWFIVLIGLSGIRQGIIEGKAEQEVQQVEAKCQRQ
jgi:peptidoglycan biosynthesis protein MviN/MurJ (putative lipid II flippase)